jgi:hypothetical protein
VYPVVRARRTTKEEIQTIIVVGGDGAMEPQSVVGGGVNAVCGG